MLAQRRDLARGEALHALAVTVGRALERRERLLLRDDTDVARVGAIEIAAVELREYRKACLQRVAQSRRQCHADAGGELLEVSIDGDAVAQRRFGEAAHGSRTAACDRDAARLDLEQAAFRCAAKEFALGRRRREPGRSFLRRPTGTDRVSWKRPVIGALASGEHKRERQRNRGCNRRKTATSRAMAVYEFHKRHLASGMPLRILGILTVNITSSVMHAAKAMTKSLRRPADVTPSIRKQLRRPIGNIYVTVRARTTRDGDRDDSVGQ